MGKLNLRKLKWDGESKQKERFTFGVQKMKFVEELTYLEWGEGL